MKVAVSLYGRGHEFSIGTISQEIWDYIQEKYDGDFDKYLDGLENGEVPEDLMLAEDKFSLCDCDDLYHEYSAWLESCTIEIEDEDGNMLFSAEGNALEKAGVKVERSSEHVDENARYLVVFSSEEKGKFREGEFEIEGEFDPQKLTIYCSKVCFGNSEDNYMVDSLVYDDQDIDWYFNGTDGKGSEIYMLDTQANEDKEDED